MSVPIASGVTPAATDAAAPPDEPPGVSAGSQGLRVMPDSRLSVRPSIASSGVVVLPMMTAPAARSRSTQMSSRSGTCSRNSRLPQEAGRPPTKRLSFTDTGIPSSGPRRVPVACRAVAASAAASAPPRSTWVKAFSTGSVASSRASACCSNCSGVMSRASSSVDNAVASSCQVMRVSSKLSLRPRGMGPSRWGARAACQAKAVAWHLPAAQPPGGYPQRGPAGASVHKPAMLPTKKTCECTHNRTVIVARGFLVDCRPTRASERPTRCTAFSEPSHRPSDNHLWHKDFLRTVVPLYRPPLVPVRRLYHARLTHLIPQDKEKEPTPFSPQPCATVASSHNQRLGDDCCSVHKPPLLLQTFLLSVLGEA